MMTSNVVDLTESPLKDYISSPIHSSEFSVTSKLQRKRNLDEYTSLQSITGRKRLLVDTPCINDSFSEMSSGGTKNISSYSSNQQYKLHGMRKNSEMGDTVRLDRRKEKIEFQGEIYHENCISSISNAKNHNESTTQQRIKMNRSQEKINHRSVTDHSTSGDMVAIKKQPIPSNNLDTMWSKQYSQARFNNLWESALLVMKRNFGISSMRNMQPQAIQGVLRGENQIIIMATGSGKSLCYQLPASVLPGLAIVVSPLIALMVDQVQSLKQKGVEAVFLSSADNVRTKNDILARLGGIRKNMSQLNFSDEKKSRKYNHDQESGGNAEQRPHIKLLYCTPEMIATPHFRDVLQKIHVQRLLSLIAIDEAHCVSTWGHDFRPAYRKLSWLRTSFPHVPCMACTATATPRVIRDIKEVLSFSNEDACLLSSFNRPNISYEVRYKDNMGDSAALQDLIRVVKTEHSSAHLCSGIVYVHKRDDTIYIAKALSDAGISAAPYHAGLKDDQRKDIQNKWTTGAVKVAVATVAFGMGIDLPHVRYVLHWSLAKSIEGFYQESGRCGRDSKPARSILYYSRSDASLMKFLCMKEGENRSKADSNAKSSSLPDNKRLDALQAVIDYCILPGCRRRYLLKYFGEAIDPKIICKSTCDFCKNPDAVEQKIGMLGSVQYKKYEQRTLNRMDSPFFESPNNGYNGREQDDDGSTFSGNDDHDYDDSMNIECSRISEGCGSKNKLRTAHGKTYEDMLSHFETQECQAGKKDGFVHFKAKTTTVRQRLMEKMKT